MGLLQWFKSSYWNYLINGAHFPGDTYADGFTWTALFCRMRSHPDGVVWYSQGLEPDMTCRNCGDNLG